MKTKQEILKAIRVCAKKLGRNPNLRELRRMAGVNESNLYRHVGNLRKALLEAGLTVAGSGFQVGASTLLLDWAEVVRKLGKIPTVEEYVKEGGHSPRPFYVRFERWPWIGRAFRKFAESERMEPQWQDVLRMITAQEERAKIGGQSRKKARKCPLLMDRPVYGEPLLIPGMAHAPVNEAGVMFAFGVLAPRLGFVVKRWQAGFPDCQAVREMAKGQWQDVNVEVEFESRNFLKHGHDPKKCDVIVCWIHNWPECPVEVVELRNQLPKLP